VTVFFEDHRLKNRLIFASVALIEAMAARFEM